MNVRFEERFTKGLLRAPRDVRKMFVNDVVPAFQEDPFAPGLRNHALHDQYARFRSIDVTDDYRALFILDERTNTSTFHFFGTHKELYG